jgi:hypothetical protein
VEVVHLSDGDPPAGLTPDSKCASVSRIPYLVCHPERPPPYWIPSVVDAGTVPANPLPQDEIGKPLAAGYREFPDRYLAIASHLIPGEIEAIRPSGRKLSDLRRLAYLAGHVVLNSALTETQVV